MSLEYFLSIFLAEVNNYESQNILPAELLSQFTELTKVVTKTKFCLVLDHANFGGGACKTHFVTFVVLQKPN